MKFYFRSATDTMQFQVDQLFNYRQLKSVTRTLPVPVMRERARHINRLLFAQRPIAINKCSRLQFSVFSHHGLPIYFGRLLTRANTRPRFFFPFPFFLFVCLFFFYFFIFF